LGTQFTNAKQKNKGDNNFRVEVFHA
jgi:hypothetical protein